jgi:hypothetical protein
MYEHDKDGAVKYDKETGLPKARTAHSLNPVPAILYDPANAAKIKLTDKQDLGISSLAATCLNLLGYHDPRRLHPLARRDRTLGVFHTVENFFPYRGKTSKKFSILWKNPPQIFHTVENFFPHCGKLTVFPSSLGDWILGVGYCILNFPGSPCPT